MDHHNSEIYYRLQSYIIPLAVHRSERNAMLGKWSYGIRLTIYIKYSLYMLKHTVYINK